MLNGKIEAIAFDFGNTLCPWDEEQYWQVTNTGLSHICSLANGHTIDSAYKVFNRVRAEDSARNLPRLVENDLVRMLADTAHEIAGRPLGSQELNELMEVYTDAFVGVCKTPSGLIPMLERLSVRYRLAVLSNYPISECIRRSLDNMRIARFFEVAMVSGDEGLIKPSRVLFGRLLSNLDLPPERVLYVGDDWIADIVGACASGMPCVHIHDGKAVRKKKIMESVFGMYLRKALEHPELACWRDAKPETVLSNVLELEAWLEEQAE